MLKLQYPDAESEDEAAALAAWGGHGAVLLVDHAPELRALLVERCVPGSYFSEAGADEALDVVVELLPRLSVSAPSHITSLQDGARRWAANLPAMWESAGCPFDVTLLDTAAESTEAASG